MRARFRIVHFTPDPFSGMRVPIAAIVEGDEQGVQVAHAPFIPGPHCVGGLAAWSSIQMALEDLHSALSFEQLPRSIGPFVLMDEPRFVPASVSNPVQWVEQHVLPRPLTRAKDQDEHPPKVPRRQSQGRNFFKTWKVAHFVKRKFDGGGVGLQIPKTTAVPISHWVLGSSGLLLMEPLVGAREDFHSELTHVSNAFLAWRKLFENHRNDRGTQEPNFIAYVLDGKKGEAATVRTTLKESGAKVIDVTIESERHWLIERIKLVGKSGPGQGQLPLQ